MNACHGNMTVCTGDDLRPIRLGLRREVVLFCAPCRSTSLAISAGVHLVERRVEDVPVPVERRHAKPRWLARLTNREDGSWRAA